jgi:hypothetical protein
MGSSSLTQKVKNYQPDGRKISDRREDDVRTVCEKEQADKSFLGLDDDGDDDLT